MAPFQINEMIRQLEKEIITKKNKINELNIEIKDYARNNQKDLALRKLRYRKVLDKRFKTLEN